jgi:hypothetical protein
MAKRYYSYEETHETFNGVKHKRCTKCRKWKQESEFHKDRARRDGLRLYCKGCAKVYERKVRRKNSKAVREYLRYEDRHRVIRGFKEKLCGRCKQWKYESDFYRNRRLKDGLSLWCKECKSKRLEHKRKKVRRNLRYEDRHRTVDGVKEKFCRKCGKWKKENEYYKHRSSRDGLDDRCKQCAYKPSSKSRRERLAVKK